MTQETSDRKEKRRRRSWLCAAAGLAILILTASFLIRVPEDIQWRFLRNRTPVRMRTQDRANTTYVSDVGHAYKVSHEREYEFEGVFADVVNEAELEAARWEGGKKGAHRIGEAEFAGPGWSLHIRSHGYQVMPPPSGKTRIFVTATCYHYGDEDMMTRLRRWWNSVRP